MYIYLKLKLPKFLLIRLLFFGDLTTLMLLFVPLSKAFNIPDREWAVNYISPQSFIIRWLNNFGDLCECIDRGKCVVNLGCCCGPYFLVSSFIQ